MPTRRPTTSYASARPDMPGPAATAALRATSGRRRWRGECAGRASATTTLTPATRGPVTRTQGTAAAACTTLPGPAAPSASLAISAMPCSAAAAAVAVTRGERCLPTALLAPAAVTAPREPAPAEPMWWAGAATAAHPTSGTWGGRGAVSLVDAIPRTPRTLPVMRSRGSAAATSALVAVSVPSARSITGETPSCSAKPASVSRWALRARSVTEPAGSASADQALGGCAVTAASGATRPPSLTALHATPALGAGMQRWAACRMGCSTLGHGYGHCAREGLQPRSAPACEHWRRP